MTSVILDWMSGNRADELATMLRDVLDLAPYESRAYFTLITNGEVSPSKLSQLSGIPRTRAYDVLRTLVGRGLATERLGRPLRYAAVDPRNGLASVLDLMEEGMKRDTTRRRATVRQLADEMGKVYDELRYLTGSDQRVVVGSSSRAVWRQFEALKQQTKNDYVGVSVSALVPPYEIFAQEDKMLERHVEMKLIRPFPDSMRRTYVEWYVRLIRKGFEIRSSNDAEFSFDVSDSTNAVIWLNERADHPPTETIWLQHAPMARMLREDFDRLWRRAVPVEHRLEKILESG